MEQIAGHNYHVYNRRVSRLPIFVTPANYVYLVRQIKAFLPGSAISIIAYCLMPNHYHFLLRAEADDAISPFIQKLFSGYTQAFNRQENRKGTLFEGRMRVKWIDKDEYLIHLVRYIHLNPVKAGLFSHPKEWEYSNYREWVGLRQGTLVDSGFVEEIFPRRKDYEDFVLQEICPEMERRLIDYYLD